MEHTPVKSSAMKSVGYHNGVMEITFNTGKTTSYGEVSPSLHAEFMASDSKGKFFAQKIRGQFTEKSA